MINKKVIVINGGSNTIKFKTFDYNTLNVVCSGACKRITVDGVFTLKINGKVIDEKADFTTFNKAIKYLVNAFKKYGLIANSADIIAFGHRIVRGSSENDKAQVINKKVFNDIKKNCFTAPLHNKPELVVIKAFKDVLPTSKHVAVFDSAFHLTMPKLNYFYPVEKKLREKYDIRRYGAHGTSYKYITAKMQGILKKKENNLIICHLGSGCSICAIKDSKSYDTSMGYTPLEGLLMSTRCGNIDGGIILDLTQNGIKPENLNNLLNKESGWYSISGMADMQDNCQVYKTNKNAAFAIELFCKRVADYIVTYANNLENIDAIVFTGGIGENSPFLVNEIIKRVKLLKLKIDSSLICKKYVDDYKLISAKDSECKIYCVKTDEEKQIAIEVRELID